MKELSMRVLTGVIGIFLLIFVILKGELYLSFSIFILSIIGLREFYGALNNINIRPVNFIGYISSLGIFVSNVYEEISVESILALTLIGLLIFFLFRKNITIGDIGMTLLGIIYIPFLLSHVYYLNGTKYIWLIFIMAFGTDTFAYIAGNLFGKNKLSPSISPNKTIEGSIGGILGSLILTIVYSLYFGLSPLWKFMILAIIASIISQIGDLVASKIKRIVNIKDYGFIMPGHGGVLDRFDSIIFSAPLIYYFTRCFLI